MIDILTRGMWKFDLQNLELHTIFGELIANRSDLELFPRLKKEKREIGVDDGPAQRSSVRAREIYDFETKSAHGPRLG